MRELVKFIEHVSNRLKGLNSRSNLSSSSVLLVSIIVLLLQVTSCTITKRVHRKGFHVEWHTNYKSSKSAEANPKDEKAKPDSNQLFVSHAHIKDVKKSDSLDRAPSAALESNNIPAKIKKLKLNADIFNNIINSNSASQLQSKQHHKQTEKTVKLNPDVHANPEKNFDWKIITHIIFSALLIFLVVLGWILYIGLVQSMFPWSYVGIYFVLYGLFLILITCVILGLTYLVVYVAVTRDWDSFFEFINNILN